MPDSAPQTSSSSHSAKPVSARTGPQESEIGGNPVQKTEAIEQWFKTHAPQRPKETPKRVLSHIGIALAVAATAVAGYYWDAQRQYAVKKKLVEAAPLVASGDAESLMQARTVLREALDIRTYAPAVSSMAEVSALLWVVHGSADAKEDALKYTDKAVSKNIQNAERYAADMWVALGEQRFAEAVDVGEKVLKMGVVSEKILLPLGWAQRAQGMWATGLENIRKAHALKPSSPLYALALGDAYNTDFDTRNAALFWDAAHKMQPNNPALAAQALLARLRNGEDIRVLSQEMLTLVAQTQKHGVAPDVLQRVRTVQSALLERQGLYQQALDVLPATPSSETTRIRLLARVQKTDEAQKKWAALKNIQPLSYETGEQLLEAWDGVVSAQEAVAVFESALKKQPEDIVLKTLLGRAYLKASQPEAAKAVFEKILAEHKDHPEALLGMAQYSASLKQPENAFKGFEQAVAVKPIFAELYESIGLMYMALNAPNDAQAQFEGAEKMFLAISMAPWRTEIFYRRVQDAFMGTPAGKKWVSQWAAKAQAYRTGSTS
jgi:tetratricopeptide (TPR) repeat protein